MAAPFEIKLAATGDTAEAETAEAALLVAATLVDDVVTARGSVQGLVRSLRSTIYITEHGTYSGILTAFARDGQRVL